MQVLKRINSEIEARRRAGENLPPPPKTAIAGPEYFGLNQPEVRPYLSLLPPHPPFTLFFSRSHGGKKISGCALHGQYHRCTRRIGAAVSLRNAGEEAQTEGGAADEQSSPESHLRSTASVCASSILIEAAGTQAPPGRA